MKNLKNIALLLLTSSIFLGGCNSQSTSPSSELPSELPAESESINTISETEIFADMDKWMPAIKEEDVTALGDSLTVTGDFDVPLTYKVENVEISKTLGSHQSVESWNEDELEADGVTTSSKYSYVWVTFTVKNEDKEKTHDFLTGTMDIRPKASLPPGDSRGNESDIIKAKGHCMIEPQQEVTLVLSYIILDEWLPEMYYQVGGDYWNSSDQIIKGKYYYLKLTK